MITPRPLKLGGGICRVIKQKRFVPVLESQINIGGAEKLGILRYDTREAYMKLDEVGYAPRWRKHVKLL